MSPTGSRPSMDASRMLYWVLALALVGFGILAIFSVGMPFLALGLALLGLAPFRRRPVVFWPILSAVISFFVGYVLVAPLGCTTRLEAVEELGGAGTGARSPGAIHIPAEGTTCTNLLGINYSGPGVYNPPLWPAVVAGATFAVVVALVLRQFLAGRAGRSR